jgi:hypothetical protein
MTGTALEFVVRVDAQGPFRCTLEQETDVIDVTTATGTHTPNLAWEFVDEAGHYHAWTKDGKLPTVAVTVNHFPCNHDHEDEDECGGWDESKTVCLLCAEPIEPKYVVDHSKRYLPGRTRWEANVYGVHLEYGMKVSLAFANAHTGRVLWFGMGQVVAQNITTEMDAVAYVSKVTGVTALGRKGS